MERLRVATYAYSVFILFLLSWLCRGGGGGGGDDGGNIQDR